MVVRPVLYSSTRSSSVVLLFLLDMETNLVLSIPNIKLNSLSLDASA